MTSAVAVPSRAPAETIEQSRPAAASDRNQQSLLFALPKGRLAQDSLSFLEQAGLSIPTDTESRKLILPAADGSTGFVMAKPRDVPTYVEHGAADLGICGLDVVRETDRAVYEPLLLPFGHCRLSVAGPADEAAVPPGESGDFADLAVKPATYSSSPGTPLRYMSQPRIATEYPHLSRRFFAERGVNAEIIALGGSVELGPILGLADLIVDVVQTGTTLRMNGLVEIRTILESQAVLVVNRASYQLKAAEINRIIERMRLLTT
ncbi:MAG: ATP phosphoribosyltransferase [Caldilineaceae bacterium SB0670_bin_27]|uniref:ATP phosphoribosyltransferase n=1 Tax=Caldilineaceae bacterium SB0664_bin_27 TaxID=2605260 RepID=A0A6B0Z0J4_9CHLR|nr:ATP phosphoribosyltransferase [Caldilineaceae bacterium SB0664_bin_27]MYJ78073.1 ATP phosphoribosyltransferase [Caldilineaceae bacterium SB0670_bin_27]